MNFRRLVRTWNRARLSRHLHLQILVVATGTVTIAGIILSSLVFSHVRFQRQVDHALGLQQKVQLVETTLGETVRAQSDYLASQVGRALMARKKASRENLAAIEALRTSISSEEAGLVSLVDQLLSAKSVNDEAFQSYEEERVKIGFGLEKGLSSQFSVARAKFRADVLSLNDLDLFASAGDVIESASQAVAKNKLADFLAFGTHLQRHQTLLAKFSGSGGSISGTRQSLDSFVAAFTELRRAQDRLETLGGAVRRAQNEERRTFANLRQALDARSAAANEHMRESTETAIGWLWLNIALGIVVALAVPIWIRDTVSKPLQEMALAMQRLSNGELDVTLERCRRRNELGNLSRSFFKFQRKMRTLVELSQALEVKQDELIKRQVFLELILSSSPVGLAVFNRRDEIVICNDRYSSVLFGSSRSIPDGSKMLEIWGELLKNGRISQLPVYRDRDTGQLVSMALCKFNDGRTCRILRQAAPDGSWVATVEDVTDRVRMDEHIAHMAMHDSLTDLPNRAHFTSRLDLSLQMRPSDDNPMFVLYFDLDRFKIVNDTYGHAAGDELLRTVAERLVAGIGSDALIARLGGDEFAMFTSQCATEEEAGELAQRVIGLVSAPYDIGGNLLVVGCSVGIAIAPSQGTTASELLVKADLALYRSKQQGRGTYHVFSPDMVKQYENTLQQERELRSALVHGQFEVWYQPIYSVDGLRIAACEALLRWRHPARGLVSPAEFIPFMERSGLISPVGGWVLTTACQDAARWPTDIKVCVNVSVVQLRSPHLISVIKSALAKSGLEPKRLEIEITESLMLAEDPSLIERLQEIRQLGISLAMDDFGSGHSVLSTLDSFPFDKIKLDKSYLEGLSGGQKISAAIVRSVAVISQELHIESVGEGVETPEQLATLKSMGFTHVQGYLLARPMPQLELMARYRDLERREIEGVDTDALRQVLGAGVAA